MNQEQMRSAFEAWLNPGNHAGNVSAWVAPGRYEKETHQAMWLGWCAASKQNAAPADPMDWPLPCDVTVGHGTMRKGVRLGTLVARMKVLYEMATGESADAVASRSKGDRRVLLDQFLAAAAKDGITHLSARHAEQPIVSSDEGQKCRDCADFGPICPNSGKPCGG